MIFAVVSLISWGIWGVLPRVSTMYISPKSAFVYEVLGVLLFGIVMWAFFGFKLETNTKGAVFGILTGVFEFIGALAFVYAVSKSKSSMVVVVSALYPAVTVLLSYLFLGDTITIKQGIGMLMALGAMVLITI